MWPFDSWNRLNIEVFVFSKEQKVKEICEKENFTFVDDFKCTENELPFLDDMFSKMIDICNNDDESHIKFIGICACGKR